jgi:hypothetical protein
MRGPYLDDSSSLYFSRDWINDFNQSALGFDSTSESFGNSVRTRINSFQVQHRSPGTTGYYIQVKQTLSLGSMRQGGGPTILGSFTTYYDDQL